MFYGQIKNGATYDVLLAADAKTPKKAVTEGYGVASSVFTYAVGNARLLVFGRGQNQGRCEAFGNG